MKLPLGVRLFLAASLGALSLPVSAAQAAPDRVKTDAGVVEGLGPQASGVREFRGIPYAAPPLGPLRWREPQPAQSWPGVRDAKAFASRCMQKRLYDDMVFRSPGVSEDCLYLNVWTPAKTAKARLPVLVYFHGGGYVAGSGDEPRYDGESMASRGMVVVTINYRLGLFGFFAHPELAAESPHNSAGNYGLLDHVAALRWVQANIAAFGGDPKRVTIAGESAGSVSVSVLMASPLAKGLFSGAIGESGSLLGTLPPLPLAEAEKAGAEFAAKSGAPTLAELRALPADKLLNLEMRWDLDPTIDGFLLPKAADQIFAAGEQAHVPLLAGSNTSEGWVEALMDKDPPTVENYRKALAKKFGDRADQAFAAYPAAADGQPVIDAAKTLIGDDFIALSTWKWTAAATKTGGEPTFRYLFAEARPPKVAEVAADPSAAGKPRIWGSVHSGEIEYVLGNLGLNPVFAWTDEDRAASAAAETYFANFIKTGDPNGKGLPAWPAYATGKLMILDAAPRAAPDESAKRLEALDRIERPKGGG